MGEIKIGDFTLQFAANTQKTADLINAVLNRNNIKEVKITKEQLEALNKHDGKAYIHLIDLVTKHNNKDSFKASIQQLKDITKLFKDNTSKSGFNSAVVATEIKKIGTNSGNPATLLDLNEADKAEKDRTPDNNITEAELVEAIQKQLIVPPAPTAPPAVPAPPVGPKNNPEENWLQKLELKDTPEAKKKLAEIVNLINGNDDAKFAVLQKLKGFGLLTDGLLQQDKTGIDGISKEAIVKYFGNKNLTLEKLGNFLKMLPDIIKGYSLLMCDAPKTAAEMLDICLKATNFVDYPVAGKVDELKVGNIKNAAPEANKLGDVLKGKQNKTAVMKEITQGIKIAGDKAEIKESSGKVTVTFKDDPKSGAVTVSKEIFEKFLSYSSDKQGSFKFDFVHSFVLWLYMRNQLQGKETTITGVATEMPDKFPFINKIGGTFFIKDKPVFAGKEFPVFEIKPNNTETPVKKEGKDIKVSVNKEGKFIAPAELPPGQYKIKNNSDEYDFRIIPIMEINKEYAFPQEFVGEQSIYKLGNDKDIVDRIVITEKTSNLSGKNYKGTIPNLKPGKYRIVKGNYEIVFCVDTKPSVATPPAAQPQSPVIHPPKTPPPAGAQTTGANKPETIPPLDLKPGERASRRGAAKRPIAVN
ncbi:MAG: hypothetical protein PHV30_01955 [Candidatus Margulisbacteria bacterium]|nr:hypothetical protein [Candidatus Margulisiibacteriota bacterium]